MGITEKKVQVSFHSTFHRSAFLCFPRASYPYIHALVARVLIKGLVCDSPIYVERLVESVIKRAKNIIEGNFFPHR